MDFTQTYWIIYNKLIHKSIHKSSKLKIIESLIRNQLLIKQWIIINQ